MKKRRYNPAPDIVIVGSVNLDIGCIQKVSLGLCDSQTPHRHEPETVFAETQLDNIATLRIPRTGAREGTSSRRKAVDFQVAPERKPAATHHPQPHSLFR